MKANNYRKPFIGKYRRPVSLVTDLHMTPEEIERYYKVVREVTQRFGKVIARRLREAPNSKVRRTVREHAMTGLERTP